MVVDDAPDSLFLLANILEPTGYHVITCSSGESALTTVAENIPDLILLDIQMNGIDGFQVCQKLKANEITKDIPVIFISASHDVNEKVKGMQLGAVDYISKPFHVNELRIRVKTHLNISLAMRENIENQKKTETANNERYQSILQTAMDGFWMVDLQGQLLEVNNTYCRMSGYSREELLTMKVSDFEVFENSGEVSNHIQKIMTNGQDRFESRHHRKDGSVYDVESSVQYRQHENRIVAFIRDITERKRIEDNLRISEIKYRRLHESMMDAYVATDMNGRIIDFNPAFQNMLGSTDIELYELTYQKLTPEKWHEMESLIVEKQILPNGYSEVYEKEYYHSNGTIFPVELRTFLMKDDTGNPTGMWAIVRDITERKIANKKLHESTTLLNSILNSSLSGIMAFKSYRNNEGIIEDFEWTMINETSEKMVGRRQDELLGKKLTIEMPGNREEGLFARYVNVVETGIPLNHEHYYEHENVKTWFHTNAVKMGDGFVVTFSNITERKQAEDELRKSKSIIEAAFASMTDAVFISDIDGNLLEINNAFASFHRFINKEECPKNFYDYQNFIEVYLTNGELVPIDMLTVPRALRGETATNAEYNLRRKDTGEIWVGSYSFGPIRNLNGTITGAVVIGRDITDIKKTEIEREELAKQRQIALDASKLGWWKYDPSTNYTFWDNRYQEIYGVSGYECSNDIILKLLYPDDLPIVLNAVRDALDPVSPKRYSIEYRVNRPDGEMRWVEAHGLATFEGEDSARHAVNFVGTVCDITKQKQNAIEQSRLESQLQQSQKMESIGRLAGGVAHDFNNMLQVILGNAFLAMREIPEDSSTYESLREIQECANRSSDLTRQLLAFARKQTINPEVLDLNDTLSGMLKMLKRIIGEDIDLEWIPGPDIWQVKMDPSQIDQIFANLCVNSRDAIDGVGKMTIETENYIFDEDYCAEHAGYIPGEYVRLAVSDNGCGIDNDTLTHLFEPFFTTKEIGKGTGLGLATIYGIVKQNNGFINVYSELGQGTTFTIYLPRYVGELAQKYAKHETELLLGQETILLVEDELTILKMTTTLLHRLGYHILTASNPIEAIQLAKEHSGEINLVITDVVMPDMNGRDLVRQLHALYPKMKAMFMSGYTANVIAHHGVLDEGVFFLQKPFTINELAVKVRESLADKS